LDEAPWARQGGRRSENYTEDKFGSAVASKREVSGCVAGIRANLFRTESLARNTARLTRAGPEQLDCEEGENEEGENEEDAGREGRGGGHKS
jgi:hypothetical protein